MCRKIELDLPPLVHTHALDHWVLCSWRQSKSRHRHRHHTSESPCTKKKLVQTSGKNLNLSLSTVSQKIQFTCMWRRSFLTSCSILHTINDSFLLESEDKVHWEVWFSPANLWPQFHSWLAESGGSVEALSPLITQHYHIINGDQILLLNHLSHIYSSGMTQAGWFNWHHNICVFPTPLNAAYAQVFEHIV